MLLKKLTGLQLVEQIFVLRGNWEFITAFTRAGHLPLPWATAIPSMYPTHILKIHFDINFPTTSGSSKWSLSVKFPHESHVCYLSSPQYVPHAAPILFILDLITRIIFLLTTIIISFYHSCTESILFLELCWCSKSYSTLLQYSIRASNKMCIIRQSSVCWLQQGNCDMPQSTISWHGIYIRYYRACDYSDYIRGTGFQAIIIYSQHWTILRGGGMDHNYENYCKMAAVVTRRLVA